MIINELLSYTLYCFNSNSFDDVKRECTVFYSSDEIVNAKKALWGECETLLGPYQERKSSDRRPAIIPHMEDIVEAVKTLDTLDKIPDVVARDLSRIPNRQPREITLLAALQRIDKLEMTTNHHTESLLQLTVDVMDLKDTSQAVAVADKPVLPSHTQPNVPDNNVPSSSKSSVQPNDPVPNIPIIPDIIITPAPQIPGDQVPPPAAAAAAASAAGNPNTYSSAARRGHAPQTGSSSGTHSSAHRRPSQSGRGRRGSGHQHQHRSRSNNNTHGQQRRASFTSQHRGPGPIYDSDGYRTAMSRKSRRTIGRAAASSDIAGAPPPLRQIWVSRVTNGNGNSMKNFLSKNGVTVSDIEKTSHPMSKFSSFKITIYKPDLDKVFDENFWPDGVYCKIWYRKMDQNDNGHTNGFNNNS